MPKQPVHRTVLVTGALGGIGRAVCESFADQGHSIVAHDIHQPESEPAQGLMKELESRGAPKARYYRADLRCVEEIDAMFDDIIEDNTCVDILVNNAGIQKTAPIESFDYNTWTEILATNLTAVYRSIQRAVPGMRRGGWGRIMNISSVHGLVGSKDKAAYVAAKHGVVGLTKVISLETAGQGITVNSICPGWTDTPILEPQITGRMEKLNSSREEAVYDLVVEKQPTGKLVSPRQVAGLVDYLASNMADNITGTAMPIDGGWTCQ